MTERTTLERFAAAVTLAVGLPHPTDIYRAILTGSTEVDDGLRGTAYDTDRTSGGGTPSSHPERMLARRHPGQFPPSASDAWEDTPGTWGSSRDRSHDDLLALRRATDRVLDAVATLNAECCDAGQPDDWDEAIHNANLLAEAGYLAAAFDVGRNVDGAALRFSHAVDTVRAIRDSWLPHAPDVSLAALNEPWCRSCLRFGHRERRASKMLCRWEWDQLSDLEEMGERVELQLNPHLWPTEGMHRARHDGRMIDLKRERNDWIRAHGLNPNHIHQRRQLRRKDSA